MKANNYAIHAYVHTITFYWAPIMCQADNVQIPRIKETVISAQKKKENILNFKTST